MVSAMLGFAILASVCLVVTLGFYALHPFPHDRRSELFAFIFIGFLLALISGLAVLIQPRLFLIAPLICAVALPIAAFILFVRLRHVAQQARTVLNPHLRAGALATLKASLAKLKKKNQRAQYARRAAYVIAEAGLYEEAESILSGLDRKGIMRTQLTLLANDLAAYRVRLGDVKGAREALSLAVRPSPLYESILVVKDAFLFALEGQPDAALVIANRVDMKRLPVIHRGTLLLARAHAHAAKQETELAREVLRELARSDPEKWIDRATKPNGPASAVAIALAAEQGTPYR